MNFMSIFRPTKANSKISEKIRVGRDYQAVCPDLVPVEKKAPQDVSDRALLVWSPSKDITDEECKSGLVPTTLSYLHRII